MDTPVAGGTGDDDGMDDDASDDSTPPPPPPRPNALTTPTTTTPTPPPDHPMYVTMDAYASAAYVALSSLSLVNTPPQPSTSPSAEPPPSVDNTGASLDNNITSVGQQGVIDKDNINDHDSNNDDEVGVPLDRKDSVASMLTPPSPIVSQLPSPSRLSFRNNSHSNRLPHRRCQKTAIRPSTMPLTTTTKPTLTTPPQSITNGNNSHVVNPSATTGGHGSSSSAVGRAKSSRSSSGNTSSSSIATSSRVLGPTFSDLMRRLVNPTPASL